MLGVAYLYNETHHPITVMSPLLALGRLTSTFSHFSGLPQFNSALHFCKLVLLSSALQHLCTSASQGYPLFGLSEGPLRSCVAMSGPLRSFWRYFGMFSITRHSSNMVNLLYVKPQVQLFEVFVRRVSKALVQDSVIFVLVYFFVLVFVFVLPIIFSFQFQFQFCQLFFTFSFVPVLQYW